jgi:thymidylate kinase
VTARNAKAAKDTFDSAGDDFMKKVNRGYEKVAAELHIPVIDAGGTIDEVYEEIIHRLKL